MDLGYKLAGLVGRFLGEAISLNEFRRELAALTWGIGVWGSKEEQEMAGLLELTLSEFEAGHMTEEEFRREIATPFAFSRVSSPVVTTGANVDLQDRPGLLAWEGKQSARESGLRAVPQA